MIDRRNELVRSGMRLVPLLVLGLSLVMTAPPQSAAAQVFGGWGGWGNGGLWDNIGTGDGFQRRQVRLSIVNQGFRVTAPMRRNGSVFVADVLDRRGRRERLIVAAIDAQILQRFYLDNAPSLNPAPREAEQQPNSAFHFFDNGGLTTPDEIPLLGRRVGVPNENVVPTRRFGNLDNGGETNVVPALPVRPQPPIGTIKHRPRLVDKTTDSAASVRLRGAVEVSPLTPVSQSPPRLKVVEPARALSESSSSSKIASRPNLPMTPTTLQRRPADPLAIPGTPNASEASAPPVRSVSGGITAGPVAAAPPSPGTPPIQGDVPVAPLD